MLNLPTKISCGALHLSLILLEEGKMSLRTFFNKVKKKGGGRGLSEICSQHLSWFFLFLFFGIVFVRQEEDAKIITWCTAQPHSRRRKGQSATGYPVIAAPCGTRLDDPGGLFEARLCGSRGETGALDCIEGERSQAWTLAAAQRGQWGLGISRARNMTSADQPSGDHPRSSHRANWQDSIQPLF